MARSEDEGASRTFCLYGNEELGEEEDWGMLTKAFTSHNDVFKLRATKKSIKGDALGP